MAWSGGCHTHFRQNTLEKKVNLTEQSQGANFFFRLNYFTFLCYELSACPLILNSNKFYFASSLIARPSIYSIYAISKIELCGKVFKKSYLLQAVWCQVELGLNRKFSILIHYFRVRIRLRLG